METYCTSIIPVKIPNPKLTKEIIGVCKSQHLISDYNNYTGTFHLKTIPDISTKPFDFYYIPSSKMDIQCAFSESTLTIVLTWKNTYSDYYSLVNQSLTERKRLVERILDFNPKDENLLPIIRLLERYKAHGLSVNYAFTFYSICDENYSEEDEKHLKVLAEPSLVNMDDMLSSKDTTFIYDPTTSINKEVLETIKDVDLYSEQKTFITWASIVSLSKNKDVFVKNHITLTLMELLIQRIWNLCYSQNISLNDCITNINKRSKDTNRVVIDTYRILIESKNCISATYSSRLSSIHSAIVESSHLPKHIEDLEQKLNYLIMFTNSINQSKNRKLQQGSEILLFLIAIAQVVPLFFDLPIVTHNIISVGTVVVICVLGVLLIRSRYRN